MSAPEASCRGIRAIGKEDDAQAELAELGDGIGYFAAQRVDLHFERLKPAISCLR